MRQQENHPVISDTEAATSSDVSPRAQLLVDGTAAIAHSRCRSGRRSRLLGVVRAAAVATACFALGAVFTSRIQGHRSRKRSEPAGVLDIGARLQAQEADYEGAGEGSTPAVLVSNQDTRECRPSCDTKASVKAAPSMAGKWALRQKGTGCRNWKESKLGNTTIESSADACGKRCKDEGENCVGFNYQPEECPVTAEAEVKGACVLWKQYCKSEVNECWDDYMMLGEDIPKWTMRAYHTGCGNWEDLLLEEYHAVPTPDVCGDKCWDTPGCKGFGYQADECKDGTEDPALEKDLLEGNRPMTCYLWRAACDSERNSCWDDYVLWTPEPHPIGNSTAGEESEGTTTANSAENLLGGRTDIRGDEEGITNFISAGESAANAEPSLDTVDVALIAGDQAEA